MVQNSCALRDSAGLTSLVFFSPVMLIYPPPPAP
jgi:hypothetical protein